MIPPAQSPIVPTGGRAPMSGAGQANLADILERVLDKGIVIAGDIRVNLLDIELLTIKIRLIVASVDRAREMGIDWWERDPSLSSGRPPVGVTEQMTGPVYSGPVMQGPVVSASVPAGPDLNPADLRPANLVDPEAAGPERSGPGA